MVFAYICYPSIPSSSAKFGFQVTQVLGSRFIFLGPAPTLTWSSLEQPTMVTCGDEA